MSGWPRTLLLFTASCLIFSTAALVMRDRTERAAEQDAEIETVLRATAEPELRIRYDEGQYPQLDLPGGGRETVRSVLNITRPMRYGGYVWDEEGIPEGPILIRIDLARQLLSIFRDGHEIGSAVILYGTDGKPTPTGDFPILQKVADYHSRTYDAPMPYMLRLTDDGVAIHGSDVRTGFATHGCIGVPLAFARRLFEQAHKGDKVIILPAGGEGGAAVPKGAV
ncbi:MAG TPA: L,D-transpeptidase family protein [Sphingobium sp.]|nr:L,D-transpeptidase family protein [Sphingobium sp.]